MRVATTISLAIMSVTAQVWAASVTVPNTFVNGTTASADEVNANFDSIESAVNDNDARLNNIHSINVLVNGVTVGAFLESFASGGTTSFFTAAYIRVLLNSGYITLLSTAGDGIREFPLSYQSTDCTGQPYFGVASPNTINPIAVKKGLILLNDTPAPDTLYFVPAGTATEDITVQSRLLGGVCTPVTPAAFQVQQVSVNDSTLTGITNNLAGDITIDF